jgi:hypothetical protein
VKVLKSPTVPDGWEFWTTGSDRKAKGYEESWSLARALKERREELRPDLFVRVSVVWAQHARAWWVLRKEETRVKGIAA